MAAVHAGPVEVVRQRPPHGRGTSGRAPSERLPLGQGVAVGHEDCRRVIRRRAVRVPGPGALDDEVVRDRRVGEDVSLRRAPASAGPAVRVVIDVGHRCVRRQDDDVRIRGHSPLRGLLDVRGNEDGRGADREVPDAIPRKGPQERVAAARRASTRRRSRRHRHGNRRCVSEGCARACHRDGV